MTPDEINGLWQQSQDDAKGISLGFTTQHHYFAALVAAAERKCVAAWMMERGYSTGHGDTVEEMLKELDWQIRESERNLAAFEQALFQAQTAAIALARKVKVYEDALGEIAWSNNSEWQQDRAKQVLAKMRGVEL